MQNRVHRRKISGIFYKMFSENNFCIISRCPIFHLLRKKSSRRSGKVRLRPPNRSLKYLFRQNLYKPKAIQGMYCVFFGLLSVYGARHLVWCRILRARGSVVERHVDIVKAGSSILPGPIAPLQKGPFRYRTFSQTSM